MARIEIPEGEGGDAVQIWSLQPELSRAVNRLTDAAYNQSILPVRVREAARMRIAQLNECVVCGSFRAESVKAQGLTEDFYAHIAEHPIDRYSEQERWAIAYAERFATDHLNIDDAFMAGLHEHFSDAEIFDLTICMAHFLGLGRLLRVLGVTETCVLDVGGAQPVTPVRNATTA
ncbi:MAG: carboxymuconolactone decarboxylase family protein [Acidimicrobiales bacterium]